MKEQRFARWVEVLRASEFHTSKYFQNENVEVQIYPPFPLSLSVCVCVCVCVCETRMRARPPPSLASIFSFFPTPSTAKHCLASAPDKIS